MKTPENLHIAAERQIVKMDARYKTLKASHKELIDALEKDLEKVKRKILIDLDDLANVDKPVYHFHLGEEKVLIKYLARVKNV